MTSEDAELDQLLDSALEDFDNLPKPKVSRKKAGKRHEGGNVLAPSEEDFMKIFESVGGQGKKASFMLHLWTYFPDKGVGGVINWPKSTTMKKEHIH